MGRRAGTSRPSKVTNALLPPAGKFFILLMLFHSDSWRKQLQNILPKWKIILSCKSRCFVKILDYENKKKCAFVNLSVKPVND